MRADNSIEVESLVREFKKGPRAVDGIDLHVDPGEIYGFLGPNGAGKSTTVLMLTTLLPPTSGTARVAGHDVVREGPKVRAAIGAALQEAALDPLLTGRDHLRLQATLQGLTRPDRKARTVALLERVGLTEAADRKVRGYSGGMKRRLDLALALVHRPRVLFLDEPTTGLDPQSRSALWEEVARLAADDGVTVFLTTQYLEEADVLADRVGIIDNGRIVAEGTPAELKAEVGRPSLHAIPAKARSRSGWPPSSPASASRSRPREARRRVAHAGDLARRRRPRARPGRNRARRHRAARSDARRRLLRQDRPLARGRRGRGRRRRRRGRTRRVSAFATQIGALAARSVTRTIRQPASAIPPLVFPVALMLVNAAGLHASTTLPGFPTDSFVAFALAVPFIQGALFSTMNAGTDLARDIQTGFLNRLSLTSMRGMALLGGQLGGAVVLGLVQAIFYVLVGLLVGVRFASGVGGVLVLLLFAVLVSFGFGALGVIPGAALRLGRDRAGDVPRAVRLPLPLLDERAAGPDRRRLVPPRRDREPGLLPDRVRAQPDHHGLGRQALALGFGIGVVIAVVSLVLASWALRQRLERT